MSMLQIGRRRLLDTINRVSGILLVASAGAAIEPISVTTGIVPLRGSRER
jgi:hypothetical protein